jgi:hypothetical protein
VQLLRVTCEAGLDDLIAGRAVLVITTGDVSDSDSKLYWLKADLSYTGHITGFELTKFGQAEAYHLPADCSSCDCPDATFCEERPGGCRHMVAMRQAVLQLGRRAQAPDEDVTNADVRWTTTEVAWPGRDCA